MGDQNGNMEVKSNKSIGISVPVYEHQCSSVPVENGSKSRSYHDARHLKLKKSSSRRSTSRNSKPKVAKDKQLQVVKTDAASSANVQEETMSNGKPFPILQYQDVVHTFQALLPPKTMLNSQINNNAGARNLVLNTKMLEETRFDRVVTLRPRTLKNYAENDEDDDVLIFQEEFKCHLKFIQKPEISIPIPRLSQNQIAQLMTSENIKPSSNVLEFLKIPQEAKKCESHQSYEATQDHMGKQNKPEAKDHKNTMIEATERKNESHDRDENVETYKRKDHKITTDDPNEAKDDKNESHDHDENMESYKRKDHKNSTTDPNETKDDKNEGHGRNENMESYKRKDHKNTMIEATERKNESHGRNENMESYTSEDPNNTTTDSNETKDDKNQSHGCDENMESYKRKDHKNAVIEATERKNQSCGRDKNIESYKRAHKNPTVDPNEAKDDKNKCCGGEKTTKSYKVKDKVQVTTAETNETENKSHSDPPPPILTPFDFLDNPMPKNKKIYNNSKCKDSSQVMTNGEAIRTVPPEKYSGVQQNSGLEKLSTAESPLKNQTFQLQNGIDAPNKTLINQNASIGSQTSPPSRRKSHNPAKLGQCQVEQINGTNGSPNVLKNHLNHDQNKKPMEHGDLRTEWQRWKAGLHHSNGSASAHVESARNTISTKKSHLPLENVTSKSKQNQKATGHQHQHHPDTPHNGPHPHFNRKTELIAVTEAEQIRSIRNYASGILPVESLPVIFGRSVWNSFRIPKLRKIDELPDNNISSNSLTNYVTSESAPSPTTSTVSSFTTPTPAITCPPSNGLMDHNNSSTSEKISKPERAKSGKISKRKKAKSEKISKPKKAKSEKKAKRVRATKVPSVRAKKEGSPTNKGKASKRQRLQSDLIMIDVEGVENIIDLPSFEEIASLETNSVHTAAASQNNNLEVSANNGTSRMESQPEFEKNYLVEDNTGAGESYTEDKTEGQENNIIEDCFDVHDVIMEDTTADSQENNIMEDTTEINMEFIVSETNSIETVTQLTTNNMNAVATELHTSSTTSTNSLEIKIPQPADDNVEEIGSNDSDNVSGRFTIEDSTGSEMNSLEDNTMGLDNVEVVSAQNYSNERINDIFDPETDKNNNFNYLEAWLVTYNENTGLFESMESIEYDSVLDQELQSIAQVRPESEKSLNTPPGTVTGEDSSETTKESEEGEISESPSLTEEVLSDQSAREELGNGSHFFNKTDEVASPTLDPKPTDIETLASASTEGQEECMEVVSNMDFKKVVGDALNSDQHELSEVQNTMEENFFDGAAGAKQVNVHISNAPISTIDSTMIAVQQTSNPTPLSKEIEVTATKESQGEWKGTKSGAILKEVLEETIPINSEQTETLENQSHMEEIVSQNTAKENQVNVIATDKVNNSNIGSTMVAIDHTLNWLNPMPMNEKTENFLNIEAQNKNKNTGSELALKNVLEKPKQINVERIGPNNGLKEITSAQTARANQINVITSDKTFSNIGSIMLAVDHTLNCLNPVHMNEEIESFLNIEIENQNKNKNSESNFAVKKILEEEKPKNKQSEQTKILEDKSSLGKIGSIETPRANQVSVITSAKASNYKVDSTINCRDAMPMSEKIKGFAHFETPNENKNAELNLGLKKVLEEKEPVQLKVPDMEVIETVEENELEEGTRVDTKGPELEGSETIDEDKLEEETRVDSKALQVEVIEPAEDNKVEETTIENKDPKVEVSENIKKNELKEGLVESKASEVEVIEITEENELQGTLVESKNLEVEIIEIDEENEDEDEIPCEVPEVEELETTEEIENEEETPVEVPEVEELETTEENENEEEIPGEVPEVEVLETVEENEYEEETPVEVPEVEVLETDEENEFEETPVEPKHPEVEVIEITEENELKEQKQVEVPEVEVIETVEEYELEDGEILEDEDEDEVPNVTTKPASPSVLAYTSNDPTQEKLNNRGNNVSKPESESIREINHETKKTYEMEMQHNKYKEPQTLSQEANKSSSETNIKIFKIKEVESSQNVSTTNLHVNLEPDNADTEYPHINHPVILFEVDKTDFSDVEDVEPMDLHEQECKRKYEPDSTKIVNMKIESTIPFKKRKYFRFSVENDDEDIN